MRATARKIEERALQLTALQLTAKFRSIGKAFGEIASFLKGVLQIRGFLDS